MVAFTKVDVRWLAILQVVRWRIGHPEVGKTNPVNQDLENPASCQLKRRPDTQPAALIGNANTLRETLG